MELNDNWRGGRVKAGKGYIDLRQGDGSYKREHIVIAERALGHPLPPKAQVHHVNEVRSDNRNTNLVICENQAYHALLHRRMRARRAALLACTPTE